MKVKGANYFSVHTPGGRWGYTGVTPGYARQRAAGRHRRPSRPRLAHPNLAVPMQARPFLILTAGEFKRRLADEFDSAVSPLVFDLQLRVDPSSLAPATNASGGAKGGAKDAAAGGWKVLQAYGSPDMKDGSGLEDGTIMKVRPPAGGAPRLAGCQMLRSGAIRLGLSAEPCGVCCHNTSAHLNRTELN